MLTETKLIHTLTQLIKHSTMKMRPAILFKEIDYIQLFKSLGYNTAQLRELEQQYSELARQTKLEKLKKQSDALKKLI